MVGGRGEGKRRDEVGSGSRQSAGGEGKRQRSKGKSEKWERGECGPRGGLAVDEGVGVGAVEGVEAEVDVEGGPVEVGAVEEPDVEDLGEARAPEPGAVVVGEEVLRARDVEPDAVGVDVGDFNAGSAGAKLGRCHLCVPL